jgi:hypothetical protein
MDVLVRAHWPGRAPDTVALLPDAIANPKVVAPDDRKTLPSGFEIQRVVDLAARFKGSSTFVEDARREVPRFYKDVVQNVTNWVPKAPKYKDSGAETADAALEPKSLKGSEVSPASIQLAENDFQSNTEGE